MKCVDTIKLIIGITIIVICIAILLIASIFHFFHVSKPACLVDNIAEITILSFVSMLMGLVLIFS